MDKSQFVDELIKNVRSLSLVSVLSTRMGIQSRGVSAKGLCPFHNDNRVGSFVATESKGIFKCFSCGAGGDNIKFIAMHDGINYIESAFKIGLEYGIITDSEYETYFSKKRYSAEQVLKIQRRYEDLDKKRLETIMADDCILHRVFSTFIHFSAKEKWNGERLSPEHKEHLTNERHLSDEDIKKGLYFTFPSKKSKKFTEDFLTSIESQFKVGQDILSKIPGFYKEKGKENYTYVGHTGIGIGIKNAYGQIIGIQIRHDKKQEDKARYVWFSSSFASMNDKFEHGTSSGSPVDVVYPTEITNSTVYITEGRFKAQQLAKKLGAIAISVQGVGSWRGVLKELKEIPTSPITKSLLPNRTYKVSQILVAFDADMNYNVQVFQQARKMTNSLEDNKYPVYYLNWDDAYGKGIDDIFFNNKMSEIKRYDKQIWDKVYENMIETILDEGSYLEIKDVPSEVIRTYFDNHLGKVQPLGNKVKSPKHERLLAEMAQNNN